MPWPLDFAVGPLNFETFWSKATETPRTSGPDDQNVRKKDAISEIVTPWTETTIQLTLTSGQGNSEMNWPFLAFLC